MTTLCTVPGCFWFGKYCRTHSQDVKSAPKPAVVTPIPKFSEKRAKEERLYKKEVKEELKNGVLCVIKSPVCTIIAEGMHHPEKRTAKNLRKPDNKKPSCNACNLYIEMHPKWAKQNGHQISKFKPREDPPPAA